MVMVAPTGARRTKADHPALPMTADEIAETARDCCEAGAGALHLHVRDAEGRHALDAGLYEDAISKVRGATGREIAIQVTTEAADIYKPPAQIAVVEALKPRAISLALRELVPDAASEPRAAQFFAWLRDQDISPQFILYSAEEIGRFRALRASGVIPQQSPFLLFVLGRYSAGQQSDPEDLLPFLDELGDDDVAWMTCAFGRRELDCATLAVERGGHIRIGFENNVHLPDGSTAPSNAATVALAAEMVRGTGRVVMSAEEARAFFAERAK